MDPRDAATVMLVRARPAAGAEVYMLRRQRSMAFAGFPRGPGGPGGPGGAAPAVDGSVPAHQGNSDDD